MGNQQEEFEATTFSKSRQQNSLTELDALIAETLEESKISPKSADLEQKDASHFSATPITIETPVKIETPPVKAEPIISEKKEEPIKKGPVQEAVKKDSTELQYEKTFKTYKDGDLVKGKVVRVDESGILVDIGYKADGFINKEEMDGKNYNSGDIIEVFIDALSTKNGHAALSLKKAAVEKRWLELFDSFKRRTSLDAKVASAVGGGLVVDLTGIRGFVPASQVAKRGETALTDFVGKVIPLKVIEIDRRRGKVILSHKFGNVEKLRSDREKFFNQIDVGEILHGTVSSIKKFGAFVNINGIEGLVHINDISWKRIGDPSQVLSIGQEIDVFVLGVDRLNKKLSLGLKQLQPDPWASAQEKYRPGQIVDVKILRLAKFGAFAELEEGLEGLIHNSELSIKGVEKPDDAVKAGDIVKAMVIRIVPEEQKIGLSIREVLVQEEKEKLKEIQSASSSQKITIGDTMDESIKEQLSSQNELPPSA